MKITIEIYDDGSKGSKVTLTNRTNVKIDTDATIQELTKTLIRCDVISITSGSTGYIRKDDNTWDVIALK